MSQEVIVPTDTELEFNYKKYGFHDDEEAAVKTPKGINEDVVRRISAIKDEPEWMLEMRLEGLRRYRERPMPEWGADLSEVDFEDMHYYVSPTEEKSKQSWDEIPEYIKETYDKLGIPEAEQKFLAGVGAQYDSEVVYHNIESALEEQGVIFLSMDEGLAQYPEIVRKYYATVIPINDNKFAALNAAAWSGGSFIYVPKGVKVDRPLQAYFRINAESLGQFERTLIIADEGADVHYIEGCTAPVYSTDSLHSGVIELVALEGAHIRYTTIQNWAHNMYNLVTQRAVAHKNAAVEWIDGNIGSKVTMKYPCVYLVGEGARGEILSVAYATSDQHQDAGGKIIHAAPNTTSTITSKSISNGTGNASYRGLLKVDPGADGSKSFVRCDALLLTPESQTGTYPYIEVENNHSQIGHEATVSKIGDEEIFYLMSRGLTEQKATTVIVTGFFEEFTKQLPMEYSVEMNRLIELEMEGSVG
jgi:Fe-S cluster assembly protein SufB